MAISGTLRVSSEVNNYTLVELLDLLGSPKGVKDTLANLEKTTKKANKALNDLTKAENTREQLAHDQEKVGGMVAEASMGAILDRKVAEKAKADAKRLNTEANRKMAEMRNLVA